ncbi:MAG: DNA-binding transcriptional regulator [Friedmanniella sp.]|nr:DNA-binding transcriptional regulator [Friedmanniella sp.]
MATPPSSASRLTPDGQIRLMTKVAHLYHERGIRQADIAATLHISQARVSRLLKRAVEVGIVRTTVVVSSGVHTDLEERLERRFGLLEAVVADVEGDDEQVRAAIGSAGASYLEATLTGGERVGISSWSATLLSVVDRLRPLRSAGADTVVQLVGGVGVAAVQAQANRLLVELAGRVGASPTFVAAPGLVGDAHVRRSLLEDPAMEAVSADWRTLTLALVGVGSLQPSELLRRSGNAMAPADQQTLLAAGAVGDICQRFFDHDGTLVTGELDGRVVGIDPESFRAIPRRIAFAGGTGKHAAIAAALTGGWVNVVVTDVGTARALLATPEDA